jgi:hypothetical protein
MVSEYIRTAVISLNNTVKISQLVVELVDFLHQSQNLIEASELFHGILVCFSFESVIKLDGGL